MMYYFDNLKIYKFKQKFKMKGQNIKLVSEYIIIKIIK